MKFDIHLNVGKIFRTAKANSLEMFYTGKEIADYCNFFKLTHAVCIYDEWENLKELIDSAPNTKIYGVQWITDLADQELDIGKEGWYGIKLHSHRGYRDSRKYDRKKSSRKSTQAEWETQPLSYGLDYADDYVKTVLDRLPTGSLVYMHSQGGASLNNRARPEHLFMLATEYRNLKFIMGHGGNYGGMTATMPSFADGIGSERVLPASKDKFRGPYRNWIDSFTSVSNAVTYSNFLHNMFLDSSCFIESKALFAGTRKWAIGSDYPFGNNKRTSGQNGNDETVHFTVDDFKRKSFAWNFDKQSELFKTIIDAKKVEATHAEGIHYIEAPIEQLAKEHMDDINTFKQYMKTHKATLKEDNQ